jgi:hypothetical protein
MKLHSRLHSRQRSLVLAPSLSPALEPDCYDYAAEDAALEITWLWKLLVRFRPDHPPSST